MPDVKYPEIVVQLTERDGNAFFMISRVSVALRNAGVESVELDAFSEEATAGDYDEVLRTIQRWVTVQ